MSIMATRESLVPKNVDMLPATSSPVALPSMDEYDRLFERIIRENHVSGTKPTIITREKFVRIGMALDSGEGDSEFCEWAKTNFMRENFGSSLEFVSSSGRPVAVQDKFYSILCAMAQSGDLMATPPICAHDFLPDQLVTGFAALVKNKTERKTRNNVSADPPITKDTTSADIHAASSGPSVSKSSSSRLAGESKENHSSDSEMIPVSILPSSSPLGVSESRLPLFKLPQSHETAMGRLRSMTPAMSKDISSHGMSRETSLFQGIPNGWQYSSSDYEDARVEFIADSDEIMREQRTFPPGKKSHRPRIPSVAQNLLADKLSQLDSPQRPPFRSMDSRTVEPSTSNNDLSDAFKKAALSETN